MIQHFHETTASMSNAAPQGLEMRNGPPLPSGAFGSSTRSVAAPLAQRFDWLLEALPVERMALDRSLVRALRRLDPECRLVLRRIRRIDGTVFDLVALPREIEDRPTRLNALRKLRARRIRLGRPLRLIREAVVDREPRLANARLIHDCGRYPPSARAAGRLIRHLVTVGGSDRLGACLAALSGTFDPACGLLTLVGAKVVTVDLERPLGPESRVSLMPRRIASA